jgi:hypothetical protein
MATSSLVVVLEPGIGGEVCVCPERGLRVMNIWQLRGVCLFVE